MVTIKVLNESSLKGKSGKWKFTVSAVIVELSENSHFKRRRREMICRYRTSSNSPKKGE
jgi:hypothetical protein